MTVPRLPVSYAYTPGMIAAAGQFVVPANAATPNTQVLPSLLPAGNSGTSQLTPTATQSPLGGLFPVFCTPNAGAAQPSANNQMLPKGVVGTAQTAGSEFLIDASALAADIIGAQVNIVGTARGGVSVQAVVGAIDNVNKLVYVQVVGFTSGTPIAAPAGSVITFQIVMKDATGI